MSTSSQSNPFAGSEFLATSGASQGDDAVELGSLKHDLDPLIEARLAEVVHGLRTDWINGPALRWGDIQSINKAALGQLDKRVATTLRKGFLEISQFLAGLQVLLLHIQQLRVVREQTLLGLEQLVVDLTDCSGELVEIANCQRRSSQLLGGIERGNGAHDDRKVHDGSPEFTATTASYQRGRKSRGMTPRQLVLALANVEDVCAYFEGMTGAGYRYMAANVRAAIAKGWGAT